MQDKSRLYVFNAKELILIVSLIFCLSLISFTLGVRVGKKYIFGESDITASDEAAVDFHSSKEEEMEGIVTKAKVKTEDKEKSEDEDADKATYQKLEDEFKILNESHFKSADGLGGSSNSRKRPNSTKKEDIKNFVAPSEISPIEKRRPERKSALTSKKLTIQLGLYEDRENAVNFANGLKVRGYAPIIKEQRSKSGRLWYRISIGRFNSKLEAKDYMITEESLFQGHDHVIIKL